MIGSKTVITRNGHAYTVQERRHFKFQESKIVIAMDKNLGCHCACTPKDQRVSLHKNNTKESRLSLHMCTGHWKGAFSSGKTTLRAEKPTFQLNRYLFTIYNFYSNSVSGYLALMDIYRNWGYHWNEGGTSDDPCSETYLGKLSIICYINTVVILITWPLYTIYLSLVYSSFLCP
jgi:hypothetical protein